MKPAVGDNVPWWRSSGPLRYSNTNGLYKVIVEVDPEIAAYSRTLIPPAACLNKPKYAPHITVVRGETPPAMSWWGAFEGLSIPFEYSSVVRNDETYYWLPVVAPRLRLVRLMLGLTATHRLTRPPDGLADFHTTVGNTKR